MGTRWREYISNLDAVPQTEAIACRRMIHKARRRWYIVQISGFDAARKPDDSRLQRLDVPFKRAVGDIEFSGRIEPVTLFRCLPVEQALEWDVGHGIVVVDVPEDTSSSVGQNAIAKCRVTDARASEGVERDIGIGEAAERKNGESGAQTVAGKTYLRVWILPAI